MGKVERRGWMGGSEDNMEKEESPSHAVATEIVMREGGWREDRGIRGVTLSSRCYLIQEEQ